MAVTYGFYNSSEHDRRYFAIQMSSIFDGIIRDGIFMSIGSCLVVQATGEDMIVRVGTGRAWFNHTWTLNDSILPLEIPQSEIILNRIDAVVLEIDQSRGVRANSIKVVKGTPATNPVRPTMVKTQYVFQYPLAYISVGKGVTSIRQANITNMVGSGETPYITGILDTVNIEAMVAQWEDQWTVWLADKTANANSVIEDLDALIQQQTEYLLNTTNEWNMKWSQWFFHYTSINTDAFETWLNSIQNLLEPNAAANLANQMLKMQKELDELNQDFQQFVTAHGRIYGVLLDSSGNPILDSDEKKILVVGIDETDNAEKEILKDDILDMLDQDEFQGKILSMLDKTAFQNKILGMFDQAGFQNKIINIVLNSSNLTTRFSSELSTFLASTGFRDKVYAHARNLSFKNYNDAVANTTQGYLIDATVFRALALKLGTQVTYSTSGNTLTITPK